MGRAKMYFQRIFVMSADNCQQKNWEDVRGDGPRHSLLVCLLHSSVQSESVSYVDSDLGRSFECEGGEQ